MHCQVLLVIFSFLFVFIDHLVIQVKQLDLCHSVCVYVGTITFEQNNR